jgi:hypothetical protein
VHYSLLVIDLGLFLLLLPPPPPPLLAPLSQRYKCESSDCGTRLSLAVNCRSVLHPTLKQHRTYSLSVTTNV